MPTVVNTLSGPDTQPDAQGGAVLLDVTLRDGGYVNEHTWTVDEAASIVRSVDAAGVPFIEVGYLRPDHDDPLRPSASCRPAYLDALRGHVRDARLVVMVRPGEAEPADVAPLAGHGVGMIRVPVPRNDVAAVAGYVAAAHAAGLLVAVNVIRVSEAEPAALADTVRRCAETGADFVYLADSNGSLFPADTRARIEAAVQALAGTGVPVGFHAHDNLHLAFANSCAALDAGARMLDASMAGIGKGGGNLPLELVVAHRIVHHREAYRFDSLTDNHAVVAAQLRMLAQGSRSGLVAGILDINIDRAPGFWEEVARCGFDVLLRDRVPLASPATEPLASPATEPLAV